MLGGADVIAAARTILFTRRAGLIDIAGSIAAAVTTIFCARPAGLVAVAAAISTD